MYMCKNACSYTSYIILNKYLNINKKLIKNYKKKARTSSVKNSMKN